jgi:hypothetical protein
MSKSRGKPLPLRLPDDTVAFNNANDLLESLGVRYKRTSAHQLKIGHINYFPNTGSIHVDGERGARPQRGKDALRALLLECRLKHDAYVTKRNAEAAKRDHERSRD